MSSGDRPPADVLIDSAAHSGVFNMALDEALLELALERQHSVVRIYRWSEPTVSLGCFQSRQSPVPVAFQKLPMVRRLSGGGAILHDQELTYSVILPLEHPARHNPSGLYAVVHRALIQLLGDCGAAAALRADYDARRAEKQANAVAADAVSVRAVSVFSAWGSQRCCAQQRSQADRQCTASSAWRYSAAWQHSAAGIVHGSGAAWRAGPGARLSAGAIRRAVTRSGG